MSQTGEMSQENLPGMNGLEIAVIGMAGRFPGADDVQAFWRNILEGREAVVEYSDAQLRSLGVPPSVLHDPDYVRAGVLFEGVDRFDAALFGFTPRDAELLDPQQRLFLETAWHALEHAGYLGGGTQDGNAIGVFGGCGTPAYLIRHLLAQNPLTARSTILDVLTMVGGNGADSVATRIAYKLNLKGPAVTVQTACSTSLVAVHMACQSLLAQECDMALAGGVSLNLLQRGGYLYRNGAILSRDGHCRAFDAQASGTVLGSGAGMVVLKRLEDAIRDGDCIHAVIRGTAVNSDGADKVGFTAPSVQGQAAVIRAALAVAGVEPHEIGYVETHGTGTVLGDPIEIAALTQAFGDDCPRQQCAIGSVKSNIGHLDAAAGVTGLIKTIMALRHRTLPPAINFSAPNPQIDFAASPFHVNTRATPWPAHLQPACAGVSAFGIGGTNAHVIVQAWEQADVGSGLSFPRENAAVPAASASAAVSGYPVPDAAGAGDAVQARPARGSAPLHVLPLSAQSDASLRAGAEALQAYFEAHPDAPMTDVAGTLAVGRRMLPRRLLVLARDAQDAADALIRQPLDRYFEGAALTDAPALTFMFPGQGAQHPNMGRSFYDSHARYRAVVDDCCARLRPLLDIDLRTLLYPDLHGRDETEAAALLTQTRYTQPALFVAGYAMVQQLHDWGITPQAMIGHSIGEYVAACVAGVFSLADALHVVAMRGRLMHGMPPGAMLAVGLDEAALQQHPLADCDLAAVNAAGMSVLAGTDEAITRAEAQFRGQGIAVSRLRVSQAFHSRMQEPMLAAFESVLAGISLKPPAIPFLSNLTGTWIRPDEAQSPAYWVRQLRNTVRFADGITELLQQEGRVLLDIGPGHTLQRLVRRHAALGDTPVLAIQPPPDGAGPGTAEAGGVIQPDREAQLQACLAQLWVAGVDVQASPLFRHAPIRRLPLPLYVFDRQSYWVDVPADADTERHALTAEPVRLAGRNAWLYVPVWNRQPASPMHLPERARVLLLGEPVPLLLALQMWLEQQGFQAVLASTGPEYQRVSSTHYRLRPRHDDDFARLLQDLAQDQGRPTHVCHAQSLGMTGSGEAAVGNTGSREHGSEVSGSTVVDSSVVSGGRHDEETAVQDALLGLLSLARHCGEDLNAGCRLLVLTRASDDVTGAEALQPLQALLHGPCVVIPKEYPHLDCVRLDLDVDGQCTARRVVECIAQTLFAPEHDAVQAWRGSHRWTQTYTALPDNPPGRPLGLRRQGCYLITGGLGGIGFHLARHLAQHWQASLVLLGRSGESAHAQRIGELKALGGRVMVCQVDVADAAAVSAAVARAQAEFGMIDGVIHAAGVSHQQLVAQIGPEDLAPALAAKVQGTQNLLDAIRAPGMAAPVFVMLFSSLASTLGGVGNALYAGANACLDAAAAAWRDEGGTRVMAVNWDGWRDIGMAADMHLPDHVGISPDQGMALFETLLASGEDSQVLVSTIPLAQRWAATQDAWPQPRAAAEADLPARQRQPRPALRTAYVAPADDLEESLAEIWADMLGIEGIGTHDSLFELGGDSLLAVQLLAVVKHAYDVDIAPAGFFQEPTIAALAVQLEQKVMAQIQEEEAPDGASV